MKRIPTIYTSTYASISRFSLFTKLILLNCILFLVGLSCTRGHDRLYPYGWTRINSTFDSLTLQLERGFLTFESDSVLENAITRMGELAEASPSHPEMGSRFHYWHARMKLRKGDIDGAMDEFYVSLALTDSARNPYDVARIRWNMELEEPDDVAGYFATLDKIRLFKKFNDLPMQTAYYMTQGTLLAEVGDAEGALRCFNSADSLMKILDLKEQLAGNVINRARCLEIAGREREAAALLRASLADSIFRRNPSALNIAQWNLYTITDSLHYILEAYRTLDRDPEEPVMRTVYGSFLIKEYARRGMTDSVRNMIARVDADSAQLHWMNHKRDFYINRAEGARALGRDSEALRFYAKAIDVISAIDEDHTNEETVNIELRRQIQEMTHKMEMQRKDRTLWLLGAFAALAIIAAIVILIYHRRLMHHQKEKIKAISAREHANRKVLALEIAMEENRRMGDDIRDKMDALEKEGKVDASVSGSLEATLKSHDLTRPAQEGFVSTFSDVNPRFLEALDRKYPNLTKTDRRLAVYISLGLDNKHISRLTGVRPDSVKQARWRLRSKLGLPEDVSLEDEMRALSSE